MFKYVRERPERDNDLIYRFARTAGRQRHHPDYVLRQLMEAYVATHRRLSLVIGLGSWDPEAMVYEVADQPPPLPPGFEVEEREPGAFVLRLFGWRECSWTAAVNGKRRAASPRTSRCEPIHPDSQLE